MEGLFFWAVAGGLAWLLWNKAAPLNEKLRSEDDDERTADEQEIDQANLPWREDPNLEYPKKRRKTDVTPAEGDQGKAASSSPGFSGVEPQTAEEMTKSTVDNPFKRRAREQVRPRKPAGSFDNLPDSEIPSPEQDPEDMDPSDVEDDSGVDGALDDSQDGGDEDTDREVY